MALADLLRKRRHVEGREEAVDALACGWPVWAEENVGFWVRKHLKVLRISKLFENLRGQKLLFQLIQFQV